MKKTLSKIVLIMALMLAWTHFVLAQNYNLKDMPPLDPKVRTGVLPNGMHYFIRANNLPEKRGEFYIANNIGAIQENDERPCPFHRAYVVQRDSPFSQERHP